MNQTSLQRNHIFYRKVAFQDLRLSCDFEYKLWMFYWWVIVTRDFTHIHNILLIHMESKIIKTHQSNKKTKLNNLWNKHFSLLKQYTYSIHENNLKRNIFHSRITIRHSTQNQNKQNKVNDYSHKSNINSLHIFHIQNIVLMFTVFIYKNK